MNSMNIGATTDAEGFPDQDTKNSSESSRTRETKPESHSALPRSWASREEAGASPGLPAAYALPQGYGPGDGCCIEPRA
jgi:hypothetical protein